MTAQNLILLRFITTILLRESNRIAILEYLMQNPDRILTHDQIRNQIWALDSESASNIVAAQIRLLRKKLTESGCENPIETVRGFGYRLNSTNK